MSNDIPQHWPKHLQYLKRPVLSKAINAETKLLLAPQGTFCKTSTSATRIRKIDVPAHPACGQYGLFAARDMRPGDHIVDYMGYIHLPEESDSTSDYDLSLRHDALYLGIDAARMGNESRMVNDYRGVQDSPNAKFDTYTLPSAEIRMGIFVVKSTDKNKKYNRGIKKGEEILVSYGRGFWSHRQASPIP